MSVCGDFGGTRIDGGPCGRPRRETPCPDHDESAPDTVGQRKKAANQGAFLAAYRETGNVTVAAAKAGIGRQTPYDWLADDPSFPGRMDAAAEEAADLLEEEARRRAVEGVTEPVGWYRGSPGGTVQKYSDTLLIFLLKGIRPEKYRERHEVSGPGGGPIAVDHLVDVRERLTNRITSIAERRAKVSGNGRRNGS